MKLLSQQLQPRWKYFPLGLNRKLCH